MTAYSGYLTRSAHYATGNDSPVGVNPEHLHPGPDPDPFNPVPDTPSGQSGDVFMPAEDGFASDFQVQTIHHWFDGRPSVPTNVPYGLGQQVMQENMMADHSPISYIRDRFRLYQHATDGETIEFVKGRGPFVAGETLPESSQYLANGRNGYDQTNQPNEVYSADEGRYRLGTKINFFGRYEYPIGKFGQDAQLRGYTGLTPIFPAEKINLRDAGSAPYSPSSSGTATWTTPQWQDPSMFILPAETSMTDFGVASSSPQQATTDFGSGDERL